MDKNREAYALLIIDMQKDFVLPGAPAQVAGAYALNKVRPFRRGEGSSAGGRAEGGL